MDLTESQIPQPLEDSTMDSNKPSVCEQGNAQDDPQTHSHSISKSESPPQMHSSDAPTLAIALPPAQSSAHADNSRRPAAKPTFQLSLSPVTRAVNAPLRPSLSALQLATRFASDSRSSSPSGSVSHMADITPLPSPVSRTASPGPWKRLCVQDESISGSDNDETPTMLPPPITVHKKPNPGLGLSLGASGLKSQSSNVNKNRSFSEFGPEMLSVGKGRTISLAVAPKQTSPAKVEPQIRREAHLAEERGLIKPPTPPPSEGKVSSEERLPSNLVDRPVTAVRSEYFRHEYFTAKTIAGEEARTWRALRQIGEGTFSKVMLATSELEDIDIETSPRTVNAELVAVKVVEQGPAGGASEERIEESLKRELELMKALSHPSLVHLEAFGIEPRRALLVMKYCAGGDLFEFASTQKKLLTPALIQRMFAELVAATVYMHSQNVVHRDIKLEMNYSSLDIAKISDLSTYPEPIITLIDLGLSKQIDPAQPLLQTRCGSEDYASPELIMGQAYDGRQSDAWALGVLLYALMEGRLPFDPPPNASESYRARSRTTHRIARCDWDWYKYEEEGDMEAAKAVVDGLLKRTTRRTPLTSLLQNPWVRGGLQAEGFWPAI